MFAIGVQSCVPNESWLFYYTAGFDLVRAFSQDPLPFVKLWSKSTTSGNRRFFIVLSPNRFNTLRKQDLTKQKLPTNQRRDDAEGREYKTGKQRGHSK